MKTLTAIILTSIVLVFIIRCIKQPTQEELRYCGYCEEEVLLISEERCGTYDEVNDWFYEKAQQNELENGKWICSIKKL